MDRNRPKGNLKTIGGKLLSFAGDTTGNTEARVKGRAAIVAGRSQNAYGQAADYAREVADDATGLAEEGYDHTREYLEDRVAELEDRVRENPVAATLIAAGVGFALSLLLSSKR